MISTQEENRASIIAIISSLLITMLLVLFLLWLTIHVKNPPFESSLNIDGQSGGGSTGPVVVNMGTPDLNDNYTMPQPKSEIEPASNNETVLVATDGVNINENKTTNNTVTKDPNKNNNVNPKNTKINKWDNNLSNATSNSSSTGGTTGGVQGTIGNNPFSGSTGGTGGTGGTNKGGDLNGRKPLKQPCSVTSLNVEGVIIVNIKVNKNGDVTDADPNGVGTTISNGALKAEVRQAAFCTKFEPCSDCNEITKTILIYNFNYGSK